MSVITWVVVVDNAARCGQRKDDDGGVSVAAMRCAVPPRWLSSMMMK